MTGFPVSCINCKKLKANTAVPSCSLCCFRSCPMTTLFWFQSTYHRTYVCVFSVNWTGLNSVVIFLSFVFSITERPWLHTIYSSHLFPLKCAVYIPCTLCYSLQSPYSSTKYLALALTLSPCISKRYLEGEEKHFQVEHVKANPYRFLRLGKILWQAPLPRHGQKRGEVDSGEICAHILISNQALLLLLQSIL